MAKYNPSSIRSLAWMVLAISNIIAVVFFFTPMVLYGLYFYTLYQPSSFADVKSGLVQDWWSAVLSLVLSIVFAFFGYLLTLVFRVLVQALLCLVQIEKNTRPALGSGAATQ